MGVLLGHIFVAYLTEVVALFSRELKPRKRKVCEQAHRGWLRFLARRTKVSVVEIRYLHKNITRFSSQSCE